MSKTYRTWNPDQEWLLPPSPRDWLPEGDWVYFLLDVVKTFDLSAITRPYEQEGRGYPPFHPRMRVTLLRYGYGLGVYLSRRLPKRCDGDAAYRVIVGDDVPNFRTISDFRKLHLAELEGLFVQVLRLCRQAGLVTVGLVSLDGTKVQGNASRHPAMSDAYLQKEEHRLQEEIAGLLAQAESTDAAEDDLHGREARGDEWPAELARRESRLAKIQEAKQALEDQARRAAGFTPALGGPSCGREGGGKPRRSPKAQRNFTDPDSKIMKDWTPKERMARKLRTKPGRETYAQRKGMVEPIFGQIKQGRGFRQFLLRGLEKMRGEWSLICLTHNLNSTAQSHPNRDSWPAFSHSKTRFAAPKPLTLRCTVKKLFGSGRWAVAGGMRGFRKGKPRPKGVAWESRPVLNDRIHRSDPHHP